MRIRVTTTAVSILLLLGIGPESASAGPRQGAFPGDNGRIVTARAPVGQRHEQIVTVRVDGSHLRVLTDFRFGATEPAWSADGGRIVFVKRTGRDLYRYRDIWTMNADGTGRTRVTDTKEAEYNPSWSPDGDRIVFEARGEIHTIGANGRRRRQLTDTPRHFDAFPTFSPDGSRIAYSSRIERSFSSQEILTMALDGTDALQVTDNEAPSVEPSYSPDGARLVFQYFGGGNELAVADTDGAGFTVLTATSRDEYSPVWSPDGMRIAFSAGRYPDGLDIFTMAADGSDVLPVTSGDRSWFDWPDWQPVPP